MDVTADIDIDSMKYKGSLNFGSAFMNIHTVLNIAIFFLTLFEFLV